MSIVITPGDMRSLEQRYMLRSGVPSIDLMERAAMQVVRAMQALESGRERLAIFACGPGGNGGDGFAAARLNAERFGKSIVVPLVEEGALSTDALINCRRARETPGVAFARPDEIGRLPVPGIWVDALLGIGLTRALDAACHPLIRRMEADRAAGARVLAVDIASGLNALTGQALGMVVRATDTVTFECAKPGHLMGDGPELTGRLQVAPIGIPPDMMPDTVMHTADMADVRRLLRPRAQNGHKNSFGHLLIIAGSLGMAGAAVLAARGALRSGVGLTTVACPRSVVPVVQMLAAPAMCLALPETDGVVSAEAVDVVRGALNGKTAVAIGPGLTTDAPAELIGAVLACDLPAVIDADALNILSQNRALLKHLSPRHVITPHPGEARRLLGEEVAAPIDAAHALAALGAVAVYKTAASVIASKEGGTHIREGMCSGLSKGGSGDVLTGIVGALLAQGYAPYEAALIASVVHLRAGVRAAELLSPMGMTAEDLADQLGRVWADEDA